MPSDKLSRKNVKYMLATDLDGTLVGCRTALAKFNWAWRRKKTEILLVYITGRMFSSAWQLIIEENLVRPDILVTDVGTEIYIGPDYGRDRNWESIMLTSWDVVKIRAAIDGIDGAELQNICPRFRLGYSVEPKSFPDVVRKMQQAVAQAALAVNVVPSLGCIIDIIPRNASKGHALCYLQSMYRIRTDHVFVCGDSGNDLSMFQHGFKGIVVGNACPNFKASLPVGSREIYYSQSDYAAGILEGLSNFRVV